MFPCSGTPLILEDGASFCCHEIFVQTVSRKQIILVAASMDYIVSASRSPPGQALKRLVFWSSFRNGGAIWCHFRSLFHSLEAFGERWGLTLSAPKRFRPPKVSNEAPPRKYSHLLGSIWKSVFAYCLIRWAMFVEVQTLCIDLVCMFTLFLTFVYTIPRFLF